MENDSGSHRHVYTGNDWHTGRARALSRSVLDHYDTALYVVLSQMTTQYTSSVSKFYAREYLRESSAGFTMPWSANRLSTQSQPGSRQPRPVSHEYNN